MEKPTHVVFVPSPGFSHLVSIVELAKKLTQLHYDLHITFLIPNIGSPLSEASKSILQNLPSTTNSILLPPVPKEDLPQGAPTSAHIQLTVTHSLPHNREALNSLSSRLKLLAMIVDGFASDALECAKEFNMLSFVYITSSATTLSFCLNLPKLDQTISGEFRDEQEPIQIPGSSVSIHGRDLPNPVQDRSSEVYKLFLQRCKQFHQADGVLVNSFIGIEEGTIRELLELERKGYPNVYPIGPIIQAASVNMTSGSECLTWLDNQAPKSVLYVSFGSGGTLPREQLNELAFGLELSRQKFLWVVRAPSEIANAAYLGSVDQNDDPLHFLPYGFLERTKEQGLVVPSWVPQIEALGHSATGGFLTHCGWNSTLESVMSGIPLIAWPLFAEQRMNAVILCDGLKVALRPKVKENGLVEREEVAKVITRLMEGDEGREISTRMQKLKNSAVADAMQEDGSSTKTLIQFAVRLIGN